MPSPTQLFFDELADLSFVDETYKKRFIEELHDHIEDAIHDADVRGVDDATAEQTAVQKLGSPKKLQKNFNRMLTTNHFRTGVVFLAQCIGTIILSYAAMLPIGLMTETVKTAWAIWHNQTNPLQQNTILPQDIVFIVVGVVFIALFQIVIFQSSLTTMLSSSMKRSRFWLTYAVFIGLPLILVVGIQLIPALLQAPNGFIDITLSSMWLHYVAVASLLGIFLTICFTLAAIGVILQLQGKSLITIIVQQFPKSVQNSLQRFFKIDAIAPYITTTTVVSIFSLVYLSLILLLSATPEWRELFMDRYALASATSIWKMLLVMPAIILSFLQTLLVSLFFTGLSPFYGIISAGLFYSSLILVCMYAALFSRQSKQSAINRVQTRLVATTVGLTCFLMLTNRLPNESWSMANQALVWSRPVKHVSATMDKKVFGPFYKLYSANTLFSPLPQSEIAVDFKNGAFQIETGLGSKFTAPSDDASSVELVHRRQQETINRVQNLQMAAVDAETEAVVFCNDKSLNKKMDLQVAGVPAYQCGVFVIDGVTVASSEYLLLYDVAVNADHSEALFVVEEGGRNQLYSVSLK